MKNENYIYDETQPEFAQCQYCAYEDFAENMQEVPAIDDSAEWQKLAEKHSDACEWIQTRAFRIEN
jgi:hypothetical protein